MSSIRWTKQWFPAVMLAGLTMAVPTFGAETPRTLPGVTKPSEQRDISFNGPGVIAKLAVKEGDAVQAGQSLIDQDFSVEQAKLLLATVAGGCHLRRADRCRQGQTRLRRGRGAAQGTAVR